MFFSKGLNKKLLAFYSDPLVYLTPQSALRTAPEGASPQPHQRRIGASARFSPKIEAAEMPAGAQLKAACPIGAVEDRGLQAEGLQMREVQFGGLRFSGLLVVILNLLTTLPRPREIPAAYILEGLLHQGFL